MVIILKALKNGTKFLICTILFWSLFPIVVLLFSPFYLFRQILKVSARTFRPDIVSIMNVRDAAVYVHPRKTKSTISHFNSNILSMFSLVGPLSVKQFIQNFEKSVIHHTDSEGKLEYEKLTLYSDTWWGFPCWKKEEEFRLENHIHLSEEFEDREVTEEEIEVFLGEYNSKPFKWGVSPWELILFRLKPNSKSSSNTTSFPEKTINCSSIENQRFVVCFRFDHVLMDGFSVSKMCNILDSQVFRNKIESLRSKSSRMKKLLFYSKLIANFGNTHVQEFLEYDKNCWKLPESQLTGKLHLVSAGLDFDIAKRASIIHGVGVTSIIHSSIAGGMRNFLLNQKSIQNQVPEIMTGSTALPGPNHPLKGMVNHWSGGIIKYPVGEPDRRKRIKIVDQNAQSMTASFSPIVNWIIPVFYAALPHRIMEPLKSLYSMNTFTVSNNAGTNPRLFFHVYTVKSYRAYMPRMVGNYAIGVVVNTYGGKICYSLSVDKGLMLERFTVQELTQHILTELEILSKT